MTCNPSYYVTIAVIVSVSVPDCERSNQRLYNQKRGICNCRSMRRTWQCNPAYYDANDGCDCAVVFDPDCDKPRQRLTAVLAVSRTMGMRKRVALGTAATAFGEGCGGTLADLKVF